MTRKWPCGLLIFCGLAMAATGQDNSKPRVETKAAKIARALSAAPPELAKDAKVAEQGENGNQTVLRESSNGFPCFVGHPGEVGGVNLFAQMLPLCNGKTTWHNASPSRPTPNRELSTCSQVAQTGAQPTRMQPLARQSRNRPIG